MQRIPARAFLFVLGSALLQVFCFPTSGAVDRWRGALCWIALIPFLLALTQKDRLGKPPGVGAGITLGYLCGIVWYLGNCSWIYQTMYLYGGMEKPIAFLILVLFSLYLGLYHALFGCLFTFLNRSRWGTSGALFLSPFVWTAVELLRSRLTGFPWDLLGNTQVDNSIVTRLAPLGGVMAISFCVVLINAAISLPLMDKPGREIFCRTLAGLSLLIVILLEVGGNSDTRQQNIGEEQALLLQENISVGVSAKQQRPLTLEEEMQAFSSLSTPKFNGAISGKPSKQPTVIIWPEAPSHLRSDDQYVTLSLSRLSQALGTPIVAGGLGVDADSSSERGYSLFDSAMLFDAKGSYIGRYDKIHLVPWGEYVPYKHLFAFASKLTEGSADMNPGQRRSVFRIAGHTFGVFICYESIFGDEVRQFVKNGAEVLVNISDDGWYGDTGAPWQHLNMARMRAIENRRWLLRATNTGETTVIDPHGAYIATQRHVRAAYTLPFSFSHTLTFYTRYGDWFAYFCSAVTIFALSFTALPRRTSPGSFIGEPIQGELRG